jgi:hypothetical protein
MSITSEPDGVYVAHVQSAITAGLEKQGSTNRPKQQSDDTDTPGGSHSEAEHHADPQRGNGEAIVPTEDHLSGESERIGSGNWEDDVPFGQHVGYL